MKICSIYVAFDTSLDLDYPNVIFIFTVPHSTLLWRCECSYIKYKLIGISRILHHNKCNICKNQMMLKDGLLYNIVSIEI